MPTSPFFFFFIPVKMCCLVSNNIGELVKETTKQQQQKRVKRYECRNELQTFCTACLCSREKYSGCEKQEKERSLFL